MTCRALRPLAAVAVVSVIGAGCARDTSGIDTDGAAGKATTANRGKAVRFAECMRAHGISGFPDPDASGELTIDAAVNGSSLDPSSPAWKQAISACRDLQPSGFTGHKRSAEQQADALRFAQCVRANGVPDFPDPGPGDPLVDTNRIPSAAGRGALSMPELQAALQKCGTTFAAKLGLKGQ